MQIREARIGDLGAIEGLVQRAYSPYVARIGRRPAPMDDDYAKRIATGDVFVADHAGVVGAIVLILDSDHVLIENVAVDPPSQRAGIGRALLAFAEEHAQQAGVQTLRLYTNAKMTENLALYRRLGYEETERRGEAGFERVFLSRQLGPRQRSRPLNSR